MSGTSCVLHFRGPFTQRLLRPLQPVSPLVVSFSRRAFVGKEGTEVTLVGGDHWERTAPTPVS